MLILLFFAVPIRKPIFAVSCCCDVACAAAAAAVADPLAFLSYVAMVDVVLYAFMSTQYHYQQQQ